MYCFLIYTLTNAQPPVELFVSYCELQKDLMILVDQLDPISSGSAQIILMLHGLACSISLIQVAQHNLYNLCLNISTLYSCFRFRYLYETFLCFFNYSVRQTNILGLLEWMGSAQVKSNDVWELLSKHWILRFWWFKHHVRDVSESLDEHAASLQLDYCINTMRCFRGDVLNQAGSPKVLHLFFRGVTVWALGDLLLRSKRDDATDTHMNAHFFRGKSNQKFWPYQYFKRENEITETGFLVFFLTLYFVYTSIKQNYVVLETQQTTMKGRSDNGEIQSSGLDNAILSSSYTCFWQWTTTPTAPTAPTAPTTLETT